MIIIIAMIYNICTKIDKINVCFMCVQKLHKHSERVSVTVHLPSAATGEGQCTCGGENPPING